MVSCRAAWQTHTVLLAADPLSLSDEDLDFMRQVVLTACNPLRSSGALLKRLKLPGAPLRLLALPICGQIIARIRMLTAAPHPTVPNEAAAERAFQLRQLGHGAGGTSGGGGEGGRLDRLGAYMPEGRILA